MAGMNSLNFDELAAPEWWSSDAASLHETLPAALSAQRHKERWKYTRQDKILALLLAATERPPVLTNIEKCTNIEMLDDNQAASLMQSVNVLESAPETMLALGTTGLQALTVPAQTRATLEITHTDTWAPTIIFVGENAEFDLVETHRHNGPAHVCLWLVLADGATVTHSRNMLSIKPGLDTSLETSQPTTELWQFLRTELARDSHYTLHNHSTGGKLHRQDIQIALRAPGASAELTASACVTPGQHLDQQTTVEHYAGHTSSQQTIHNIACEKAKVTFNGRIHIHENAPGSAAHLTNRNICLGEATVNTKPELEIYTDDVQCSHGATIGRLDDAHRFYCLSRGIDPTETRHLLSKAFLQTATQGPLAEPALTAYFDTLKS